MAGGDKKAKAKETIKSAVPDSLSSNSEEESYIKDFVAKMQKEAENVKDAVKH